MDQPSLQNMQLPLRPNTPRKVPTALIGLLSYLSLLCLIPLFVAAPKSFESYHALQGTALLVLSAVGLVVGYSLPPAIGSVIFASMLVANLVCIIIGTRNVLLGLREPLPLVGHLLAMIHTEP